MTEGIIAGLAVAVISGVVAAVALRWSLNKGMQILMIAIFGGMILRLLMVAVCSALILKLTPVDPKGYGASLVLAYLLFLTIEILYVMKKKVDKAERKWQDGAGEPFEH